MPFDTMIFLLILLYEQKSFLGYSIIQFPSSVFSLIVCLNSKVRFSVFIKLFIILSFTEACEYSIIFSKKKKIKKIF